MIESSVVFAHIDGALNDHRNLSLALRVERTLQFSAPAYECDDGECSCDDVVDSLGDTLISTSQVQDWNRHAYGLFQTFDPALVEHRRQLWASLAQADPHLEPRQRIAAAIREIQRHYGRTAVG